MKSPAAAVLAACCLVSSADAFELRVRWVQQIGAEFGDFAELPDNTITVAPSSSTRFRLQFGVFDDAESPAPEGGYIGWNVGTLTATGGTNTRTGTNSTPAMPRGRLAPFNFAPSPPGDGLPSTDPWTALTSIDNTLGTQLFVFGVPPIIRGRNTFISTYEITSVAGSDNYTITAAGQTVVAQRWVVAGDLWAPLTLPPIPFQDLTLTIIVPAPAATSVLALAGLIAARRRTRNQSPRFLPL